MRDIGAGVTIRVELSNSLVLMQLYPSPSFTASKRNFKEDGAQIKIMSVHLEYAVCSPISALVSPAKLSQEGSLKKVPSTSQVACEAEQTT
jgi:bisphosphoglycerate-independent phosphoglycerate mutase (AlkP superfamily)